MVVADIFEKSVSKTLLIPLLVRSLESELPHGLFRDKSAQDAVARLSGDVFKFSIHPCMRIGTAVRVRYFDDLVRDFLHTEEQPVIVGLGCGLDTRFFRVDSGKGHHVNIDFPDVIALRREILPRNTERNSDLPGDLLERDWMDKLEREYAGHRFMFTAEGVLMYFTETEARKLVTDIADRFPGAHIVFDTTGRLGVRSINKKSAVRQLEASLVWAYDDDGSLDTWHPRLRRLERAYYFNRFSSRWGVWSLMRFTRMGKTSAMFHFLIEKSEDESSSVTSLPSG